LFFYATGETIGYIKQVQRRQDLPVDYVPFEDWEDFQIISRDLKTNGALIVVLRRKNGLSDDPAMKKKNTLINTIKQLITS
jgi:soluble P-type ATPase